MHVVMTEMYNPSTDTWSVAAPMRTLRGYLACCTLNNRLYAIGGVTGDGSNAVTEVLERGQLKWSMTRVGVTVDRAGHACVSHGDHIYIIGGTRAHGSECLRTVERYDVGRAQWEARSSMANARKHLGCAVLGDHIYAVGGCVEDWGPHLASVERYLPSGDTWEAAPALPIARSRHAVTVLVGPTLCHRQQRWVVPGDDEGGPVRLRAGCVGVCRPPVDRTTLPGRRDSQRAHVRHRRLFVGL